MMIKTLFGLASLALLMTSPFALADEDVTLKTIMQGLSDDLVAIADGLLIDDFEQVARGAMKVAEHPKIPPAQVQLVVRELGPEMPAFKQMDTLVHDLALEIHAAAAAHDRAAAIAGYKKMLDGCLACHAAYKERVGAVLADAAID